MINLAAILSIKNMPFIAEYGLGSVLLLLFAALAFLVPVSLVSAELASTYPEAGGVMVWARRAFGHKIGFLAIWLLWIENTLWYPTILSFIASAFSYVIDPSLTDNHLFIFTFILASYWLLTWLNCKGMQFSSWISTLGFSIGTLIPSLTIIALAISWFFSGQRIEITLCSSELLPKLNSINDLVFFAGILLSLAGMEMSAVHVRDVQNPQRNYPRAIALSSGLIVLLFILGVVSIALVVPKDKINLISGSLQAFEIFFGAFNLKSLIPLMAILIGIGALTGVSTWIVGPSKGLLAAAEAGDLPKVFAKKNASGMPRNLLIAQGVLVSLISFLFIFSPSVSGAFWIATASVAQLYLLMYLIVFAAAIRLRYKEPSRLRPFRIPFGNIGMWIVGLVGILTSVFAIAIGFFPPSQIDGFSKSSYVIGMVLGMLFFSLIPFAIFSKRKRSIST